MKIDQLSADNLAMKERERERESEREKKEKREFVTRIHETATVFDRLISCYANYSVRFHSCGPRGS